MAATVEWRSSAHSVGNFDGNGEVHISSEEEDLGAVALVLDLATAFER